MFRLRRGAPSLNMTGRGDGAQRGDLIHPRGEPVGGWGAGRAQRAEPLREEEGGGSPVAEAMGDDSAPRGGGESGWLFVGGEEGLDEVVGVVDDIEGAGGIVQDVILDHGFAVFEPVAVAPCGLGGVDGLAGATVQHGLQLPPGLGFHPAAFIHEAVGVVSVGGQEQPEEDRQQEGGDGSEDVFRSGLFTGGASRGVGSGWIADPPVTTSMPDSISFPAAM